MLILFEFAEESEEHVQRFDTVFIVLGGVDRDIYKIAGEFAIVL